MIDDDTKFQAVLKKLAHLRTLAARAATPGEAEAASRQAAAIIAKYQIDEASVPVDAGAPTEAIGRDTIVQGKTVRKWASALLAGLAKFNGCAAYQSAKSVVEGNKVVRQASFNLVGRPSDIAFVKYMYAWLTVEIVRLSQREQGKSDRNAFCLGAMVGILRVMRDAQATEVAQASASTAMVLSNRVADAKAWIQAEGVKLRSTSVRPCGSASAQERGFEAGSRINTNQRALEAAGPRRLGSGS